MARSAWVLCAMVALAAASAAQAEFRLLQRTVPPVPPAPLHVGVLHDLIDLDHDRDLDLVGQSSLGPLHGYEGSMAFGPPVTIASLCATTRDVGSGDVNGDGHVDHLIASSAMTYCGVVLLIGNGSLSVIDESATRLLGMPSGQAHGYQAATLVDVDGDGDLDGILGPTSPLINPCQVLVNDGRGYLTCDPQRAITMHGTNFEIFEIQAADLDRDGDEDLIIGTGPPRIYLNDGTGHFTLNQEFTRSPITFMIEIGDLNGDDSPDLVLFSSFGPGLYPSGPNPTVMINDGLGSFNREPFRLPPGHGEYLGAIADFDDDGDLDIIAAHYDPVPLGNGEYEVYAHWLNDGNGFFTEADPKWMPTTTVPGFTAGGLVAGDIDDDGDVDLVASGSWGRPPGVAQVLWNMTRHVYPPAPARLGQTYEVEVYADAGHLVGLMLGFGPGWFDLGALGAVRFDPSFVVPFPLAVVPASRKLVYSVPISTDPVLLGLDLHWQALDVDPIALERSRLTGVFRDVVGP